MSHDRKKKAARKKVGRKRRKIPPARELTEDEELLKQLEETPDDELPEPPEIPEKYQHSKTVEELAGGTLATDDEADLTIAPTEGEEIPAFEFEEGEDAGDGIAPPEPEPEEDETERQRVPVEQAKQPARAPEPVEPLPRERAPGVVTPTPKQEEAAKEPSINEKLDILIQMVQQLPDEIADKMRMG